MNIEDLKNKKFLPNSELHQLVDLMFSEMSIHTIDSFTTKRQLAWRTKEWFQDNGLHHFADRWSLCLLIGGLLKLSWHNQIRQTKRIIQS